MNRTDAQLSAVAIIPARYNSTRLEGKPLLEIGGRAMIPRVVERCLEANVIKRVIVATDDERIARTVRDAGYEAQMTRRDHPSGSDRLAEVSAAFADDEIIVNVQGDEPLISPRTIERAVSALVEDSAASIATVSEAIATSSDVLSPDVVKVVVDERGRALYFSRAPIPYPRDAVRANGSLDAALANDPELLASFRKHAGLYVYRRSFLLEYARWPTSPLERAESLEQLRALERGAVIRVVEAYAPSIGVDTPEDLERVRKLYESKG